MVFFFLVIFMEDWLWSLCTFSLCGKSKIILSVVNETSESLGFKIKIFRWTIRPPSKTSTLDPERSTEGRVRHDTDSIRTCDLPVLVPKHSIKAVMGMDRQWRWKRRAQRSLSPSWWSYKSSLGTAAHRYPRSHQCSPVCGCVFSQHDLRLR